MDAVEALQFIPFKWKDSYYYDRFWKARKARKAAGLEHVKMHDKRHSLASALLSTGAMLGEVGRALNHQSPYNQRKDTLTCTQNVCKTSFLGFLWQKNPHHPLKMRLKRR